MQQPEVLGINWNVQSAFRENTKVNIKPFVFWMCWRNNNQHMQKEYTFNSDVLRIHFKENISTIKTSESLQTCEFWVTETD